MARSGDHAPGTPSGVNYSSFLTLFLGLNDAGQTAFSAALAGSGLNSTNSQGIWSEGSGSPALVARWGSQAPGTPSGVNFGVFVFASPALNDAGQIAFSAALTGSGVDTTNFRGIWSDRSGDLALVVRSGSQAPGAPSGVNYSSFSGLIL